MRVFLEDGAYAPVKAHSADGGFDLKSRVEAVVRAGDSTVFDTGVHMEIPDGYVGMLKSKSGLNTLHGLTSEGVIDTNYTGTIKVRLYNHSDEDYHVRVGDKITQIVVMPIIPINAVEVVNELWAVDDDERGNSGYGSTGR